MRLASIFGDYQAAVRELVEDVRSGLIGLTSFEDDDKRGAATLIGKYGLSLIDPEEPPATPHSNGQ